MSIELRIKSKHLALEPAIIKHEEEKLKKQIKWLNKSGRSNDAKKLEWQLQSLINHRRIDVAREARATFLARAFIAGKPYSSVERSANNQYEFNCYILPRIVAMAKKYKSSSVTHNDVVSWIQMRASTRCALGLPSRSEGVRFPSPAPV